MEAVPRMPMVCFDLKTSSSVVDFASYLSPYIAEHYHEDPGNYAKECQELTTLRQNATKVSRDFVGCSVLKKYYCQLQFLQSRFPVSELGFTFTWEDVYTGKSVTSKEIEFEMACVLYNIAALHSILGAIDNRSTPEGMKVSCTHFQCAAWALQQLRDFYGSSLSSDMSPSVLTFQINLMLGQAQECILEKSMTDNRKNTITAKVAAQIVDYYCQATKNLESSKPLEVVGRLKYKDWRKRLDMKTSYHQCIQYFYMGNQSEEHQKWGERLAYFQASLDSLNDCVKIAKIDDDEFEDPLKFTMDVVGGKFNSAKKDNEFIYHEKIPALDTLPEVKGASLVKGIPFNSKDQEISGPDIFQRLVPMEAHEASSLYSEEKAKLLRSVSSRTQEKNEELQQYESSLRLDPDHLLPVRERLPQILLEKCAAISVKPNAIKDLVGAMQELSNVATDVETTIKEIEDLLQKEKLDDKEFKELIGKKDAQNVILEEIMKELEKYKEGLSKAGNSNLELHRAMNSHITNLKVLGGPLEDLEQALPAQPEISEEDQAIVDTLGKLLCKVKEMRDQRDMLEQQLRKSIQEDDITTALVTRQDMEQSQDDFFRDQLKKHDKTVQLIDQNLSAQVNILKALTEANAQYAKFKKSLQDTNAKRESMIQGFVQSYDVYEDLLAKSQKGIDFYRKLEKNVTSLLERTQRTCKTLMEERESIMDRIAPKKPPPARPTAPKPGQIPIVPNVPNIPNVQGMNPADLAMMGLPPGVAMPDFSAMPPGGAVPSPSAAPSGTGLKLKDYLPFMKPKTFGKDRKTPSPLTAMDQYNMYAAGGLAQDPNTLPQIGAQAGALPTNYPATQQITGYPMGLPGSVPGQSLPPTQLNEVPGAPVAPPSSQIPGSMAGQTALPSQPQAPGAYNQQHMGLQQPQLPTEQQQHRQPTHPEAARTVDTIHGPIASPTEVSSKGVSVAKRLEDLPLPPGYSFTTPNAEQNMQHNQAVSGDNSNTKAPSSGGQASTYAASTQGGTAQVPAANQIPQSNTHPPYGAQYPTASVLGTQTSQAQAAQYQAQYQAHMAQYGVASQHSSSSQVPIGYGGPVAGASQYQIPSSAQTQQYQSYQSPGKGSQLPSTAQYGSNQYRQPSVPSGGSASTNVPPGGSQGNYSATSATATPSGQQANYQANQAGYQQGYGTTNQGSYPQTYQQPQAAGYGATNVSYPATTQVYSQQNQTYTQNQTPQSGQSNNQPNQSGITNQAYPQTGQTYAGTGQQYAQGYSHNLPNSAADSLKPAVQQATYPQTTQSTITYPQTTQSTITYPQTTQSTITYPQASSGYNAAQAGYSTQTGYGQTSQAAYPQSSQGSYPQTSQQSYPQTTQAGYTQAHQAGYSTSQTGYPQTSQTGYPTAGQSSYSQSAATSYPQTTQASYPQTTQPSYQSTSQATYPQTTQAGYPQTTQAGYPMTTQAGYSQVSPAKYPQTSQTGQPQTAGQASYPQTGQGSYPQTSQAGYPQTSQVTYPNTSQMNYPQKTPAGYPQTNQTTYPQTTQASYPQTYHSGYPQTKYQTPQAGYSTNNQPKTSYPPSTGGYATSTQGAYPQTSQNYPQTSQTYPQTKQSYPQTAQGTYPQTTQSASTFTQVSQAYSPAHGTQASHSQYSTSQYSNQSYSNSAGYSQTQPQAYQYGTSNFSPQHSSSSYSSQGQQQQAGYAHAGYGTQASAGQQTAAGQYGQYGQTAHGQVPPGQTGQQVSVTSPTGIDLPSPLQPTPAGGIISSPSPVHTPVSSPSAANTPSPQHRGHLERQNSTSTTSSLDDILSSSPDRETETKKPVLQPKVITEEDRAREKEEEMKTNITQSTKDPYLSKEVLDNFISQVEKFDKHVESLGKHTLSGPTPLEKEWRELNDSQEKSGKSQSMAIARCYPLKNRNPDVMPYDQNRVVLVGGKDDYINATYVGDLVPSCPKLITTQAPLPPTMADFWQMVYEQNVEVVVMLCHEQETGKHKIHVYWPTERGNALQQGFLTIGLQSIRQKQFWTERIIQMNHKETRKSRTVVHLQFSQWPPSGSPGSPAQLLAFITEVHSFYTQQRSLLRPVVVHCSDGIGRTGSFSIIYACMQDITLGNGIPDIPKLIRALRNKHRMMITDKEQLRFTYECILYHCQDILFRRGILTNKATFSDKIPGPGEKSHQRKPSEDFILGTTSNLSAIQNSVAKMSVKAPTPPPQPKDAQNGHSAAQSKEGSPVDGAVPTNGTTVIQSPVATSIDGNDVFQPPHGSVVSQGLGDGYISSGRNSRSGSVGSIHSLGTPVKSPLATQDPNGPLTLQDLQNPNTFRMDSPSSMKRVTKANFVNNTAGLSEKLDPNDPFNTLDPTWAVKK